jgi:hypothetical protein
MIRPVLTELGLFLAPFVAYALYLWATRAGVLDKAHWAWSRVSWLLIAALVLTIGSLVTLAEFSGSPPGKSYTPAHVENGVLVPGQHK